MLARFAYAAVGPQSATAILIPVWTVAALSMLVGNLAALSQTDMKRLLAYSGIAQVGYIVAAFAGQTAIGVRYAIFYLAAYTFMNLGAFAVVALMSRDADAVVGLGRFAGLAHRRPWLAALMTFFLLGLAGLPPTAGFTGKVLILAATLSGGYAWLGGVLILGTAISIYVYFKIVRAMFVRIDRSPRPRRTLAQRAPVDHGRRLRRRRLRPRPLPVHPLKRPTTGPLAARRYSSRLAICHPERSRGTHHNHPVHHGRSRAKPRDRLQALPVAQLPGGMIVARSSTTRPTALRSE